MNENEKFFQLSKDKQLVIINAGMEVFGKYEYKKAITDEIAAKAGISKGLLFHYFQNKKIFYNYLYQYCYELIQKIALDNEFSNITDFFDMLEYGAHKKMILMKTYPFIIDFVMRAFYANETINEHNSMQYAAKQNFSIFFQHIDHTKFKDDIDPYYVYQMLMWMTDGYLHEKQVHHEEIDLDDIMKDFYKWKAMFKQMVYKEEFI